ncbi:MAG: M23 family metallopeptidase [Candidatus Aminicenantes bacterium]|nr:M23 family metallopeptidase [Candidatus Aminicenantes bacterium]
MIRVGRRAVGLFLLAALSRAALSGPRETTVLQTPAGATLELNLRAWQPGEAIVVRLTDRPEGVETVLSFRDRDIPVSGRAADGSGLAFFGLDVTLKPGVYDLGIEDRVQGSPPLKAKRTVEVQPKSFPRKSLTVKSEYVFYPPEAAERIRRESELLGAVYAVRTPDWQGTGPFEAPHPARALPNFGEIRVFNGVPRSPHTGVDVMAGPDEMVRSSNAGTVVLASELYLAGNTVIVDHGLGVFTLYCHFSRVLVKRGDRVSKGDPVGRVGSTGRSTGPHLHWGVRILDARVDPASLLGLDL